MMHRDSSIKAEEQMAQNNQHHQNEMLQNIDRNNDGGQLIDTFGEDNQENNQENNQINNRANQPAIPNNDGRYVIDSFGEDNQVNNQVNNQANQLHHNQPLVPNNIPNNSKVVGSGIAIVDTAKENKNSEPSIISNITTTSQASTNKGNKKQKSSLLPVQPSTSNLINPNKISNKKRPNINLHSSVDKGENNDYKKPNYFMEYAERPDGCKFPCQNQATDNLKKEKNPAAIKTAESALIHTNKNTLFSFANKVKEIQQNGNKSTTTYTKQ
jgi:hypothetical protein